MSYEAYSDDQFLGQVGTNMGWDEACDYLEIHGGMELQKLANDGYSNDPARIVQELEQMLKNPMPNYLRPTLLNLRKLARNATGTSLVIVH